MEEIPARELRAARKFLSTGKTNGRDTLRVAQACVQLIREQSVKSLNDALTSACNFLNHSRNHNSGLKLTAHRELARINHMVGKYSEAERDYLKARRLATRNLAIRASIDRALVDLYMYLGQFEKSRQRARMAINAYSKLNLPADIAKTRVNFANLLHRQDRHRDAEKVYNNAATYFQKAGDELSTARCYYNRANTLVQLFDLAKAEQLYSEARAIYKKHGRQIEANDALYGLAWLRMLSGDFHFALLSLTECESVYEKAGHPRMVTLCVLDRAEVFLGLNLFTDALDAARQAEVQFKKLKLRYETSKAALFRAKAAYSLRHISEARLAIKRARRGFEEENNQGFLGTVLLLSAQLAGKRKDRNSTIRKARKKFSSSQLPLWEAICNIHLGNEPLFGEQALLELSKNGAVRCVPHLYAQWQTLKGDSAERQGNISDAKKHWQKAADRLDRVRAQLPPVELRSNYGALEQSPHSRLIDAESKADPAMAAVWSERFKTAGVWAPLSSIESTHGRLQVEKNLADLSQRVASYSQYLGGIAGERGNFAGEAQRTVQGLQRKVRRGLAALEKERAGASVKIDFLLNKFQAVSRRQPIVQFHLGNDDMLAFVHWQKETILRRYPGGRRKLHKAMQQWRFLLERELLSNHIGSNGYTKAEDSFFEKLGEWLWAPLEIPGSCKKVLVLPEGELANIPWQALRIGGRPLLDTYQFVLAPSLRHYLRAGKIRTNSNNVEVFVGAAEDLPQVKKELSRLCETAGDRATVHDPCTREDWPSAGQSELWHYSGHAFLRSDNPFYSYLALADGPLFAADFRLKNTKVSLVTLAGCRSGEQVAMSGEESTGLVRSLLEMGARNVVAGHWPVADDSTAAWMDEFYDGYFAGEEITDAASNASLRIKERFRSAYHWAAFSVFGAGDRGV